MIQLLLQSVLCMGEDEFKFQLVSPRVRQKHRNLAYEGKSTAGTSSSRKSWSGFRSNTPATADKITRQASNRENSDSWEVGACPLLLAEFKIPLHRAIPSVGGTHMTFLCRSIYLNRNPPWLWSIPRLHLRSNGYFSIKYSFGRHGEQLT